MAQNISSSAKPGLSAEALRTMSGQKRLELGKSNIIDSAAQTEEVGEWLATVSKHHGPDEAEVQKLLNEGQGKAVDTSDV